MPDMFDRSKKDRAKSGELYGETFLARSRMLDYAKAHTNKLADKVNGAVSAYGDYKSKSRNRYEMAGDAANALGQRMPATSGGGASYAQTMLAVAELMRSAGAAQRHMGKDVVENVVNPLREWLKTECDQSIKERAELDKRRNEMKSTKNKKEKAEKTPENRKANELEQLEQRAELAVKLHDEQQKVVDERLSKLNEQMGHHDLCVKAMMRSMRNYYAQLASKADAALAAAQGKQ